jgi:AhpD family alkylhydroperoxidase
MKARLDPAGPAELGPFNWLVCKVIALGAGVQEGHLFTTLARQRWLFRSWLLFASSLMMRSGLGRRRAELVILRVAQLRHCAYERDHHLRLAARVGLSPLEIAAIQGEADAGALTPEQRTLLAAVDELVAQRELSDATFDALSRWLDAPQLVEFCMLVGHYEMLATTIAVLRIPRDEPHGR